ncbi:MAG: substrate-binding domain-containing protein [Kiritimatiellae bacterium]|nr:substrate-binding domain-containing protein [Kiritimatiellia bacterium]
MKQHSKRIRRVAVVLRLSGTAGRDILTGIFHFTRSNANWRTRLFQMPDEFTPDAFRTEMTVGLDGIIASEPGPDETARLVCASGVPVSFIGDPGPILSRRKSHIAFTRNDDEVVGRMGAHYLASLGQRQSYGFVPTVSNQYWNTSRLKGFKAALAARGTGVEVFDSPGTAPGSREDLAALKDWLAALPKPAAVMASWDTRATQVLAMCKDAHIKIPSQVAVIGVDNDELLDESSDPPLTSILPNHEQLGYAAARTLNNLMVGRSVRSSVPFLVKPVKVAERESAIASAPAAHLLSRATAYIRKNAAKGIKVKDVAAFLGVSRRLADLRFQQFSGETINETITRHRLDAVKKFLATTNRPIKTISEECGYIDPSYLKVLFKRRFGCTMRDWRKQNRAPSASTA